MSKRMGSLGKLSQLSGIKKDLTSELTMEQPDLQSELCSKLEITLEQESSHLNQIETLSDNFKILPEAKLPKAQQSKRKSVVADLGSSSKLVPINIKITKSQKEWLGRKAEQVRHNNTETVPPRERVKLNQNITVLTRLQNCA